MTPSNARPALRRVPAHRPLATVRPLERIAAYVGGARLAAATARSSRARCASSMPAAASPTTSTSLARRPYASAGAPPALRLHDLGRAHRRPRARMQRNRSTLVFANSRRTVEKVARLLQAHPTPRVYSHHGSLSRELREVVEAA